MKVTVTLAEGGAAEYMRFGDSYIASTTTALCA